jgi:3-hydroxyisobutyrate dehydrogenase-like beta-hydroxyacid dehydrogenase
MKMVINLLLGDAMAAFAEAMALGEGLGLSQALLFESLLGTPAVAPFLAAKREKFDNRDYKAEFPLRWMQKDMHLATISAYEAGVAMPLTNVAKEIYRLAMGDGHATEDFSAIYEFLVRNGHSLSVTTSGPSARLAREDAHTIGKVSLTG